jgi:3-oxoadipate CoA-transferase, alpha subunit
VAVDGKTSRGALRADGTRVHLLGAAEHGGHLLDHLEVGVKHNETSHFTELLEPLDLAGAVVTFDALHIVRANLNWLVEDKEAHGLAALIGERRVRKMICSFPHQADSWHFDAKYRVGEIGLELVAQGTLAERIRAASAGVGAFFTPTATAPPLADGKEIRHIDGTGYVLEYPLHADFALICAHLADRLGNLVYRKTARNLGPIMAAATTTIVQVSDVMPAGGINPEHVVTPSLYADRVVIQAHPRVPAGAAR